MAKRQQTYQRMARKRKAAQRARAAAKEQDRTQEEKSGSVKRGGESGERKQAAQD